MQCTPWQECGKRIYFHFFWFEFVFKYHKTAGCNFWQAEGCRFTAKFEIGTPPQTKSVPDMLPIRRGPRPNRWSAHLGRNVEKESNIFFSPKTWSSNTIKRFDATFGSRRGTISQQNPESAHPPKLNVSLTRHQLGVGLNPLYWVYTLRRMWQRNKFPILFARICLQIP